MTSERRWAVLLPIGPGGSEVERLADGLAALNAFEPDVERIVLVDDEPDAGRDLYRAAGVLADRVTVIANPRDGRGAGWSDGLAVGMGAGLAEILDGASVAWALKLDTDALVVGPFASAITDRFA